MLGGHLYGKIYVPHTRVRYFDPERRRAGIPPDVGSLVTQLKPDSVRLVLVNLNPVHGRKLILQTGSYGEHECLGVRIGDQEWTVGGRYFHVSLAPGAGAELTISMRRYANPPTLSFPWH